MSLLEKAIRGTSVVREPQPQSRTSLFSRAMAARELVPEGPRARFDSSGFEGLKRSLDALPAAYDSIIAAWALVSGKLPLAAIALFLPKDGFLCLAAQNGFPSGTEEGLPLSLASPPRSASADLGPESRALIAPILGVPLSLSLRFSAMLPASGLIGLWVYHDPLLDEAEEEVKSELDAILSRAAASFPSSTLPTPPADPAAYLINEAWKYPSASAFAFDLASFDISEDQRLRGLAPNALRSSFLSACERILSMGGRAAAFGERSVACILGAASAADPDLALFQFTKTLRRILPFLDSASFPAGRTFRFDPSAVTAPEELSRFLSE